MVRAEKSFGNRACKYYCLVDPGSIQGSHQPVVIRGDVGNARTETTQLAKLSIDLSGELTADVFFSFL